MPDRRPSSTVTDSGGSGGPARRGRTPRAGRRGSRPGRPRSRCGRRASARRRRVRAASAATSSVTPTSPACGRVAAGQQPQHRPAVRTVAGPAPAARRSSPSRAPARTSARSRRSCRTSRARCAIRGVQRHVDPSAYNVNQLAGGAEPGLGAPAASRGSRPTRPTTAAVTATVEQRQHQHLLAPLAAEQPPRPADHRAPGRQAAVAAAHGFAPGASSDSGPGRGAGLVDHPAVAQEHHAVGPGRELGVVGHHHAGHAVAAGAGAACASPPRR